MKIPILAIAITSLAAGQAILADGHVHITNRVYWEGIDPWKAQTTGQWDYARARQGGVNFVIENIAPYGYNTYNTTVKQTGRLIEAFHRTAEAHRDKMEIALTSADVRRIVASGKMAVMLSVEAGFDQEGDIDILRLWYRLGVRVIQFSSQVTNAYADSSVRGGEKWSGINDRGRKLIAEMNRLGMLIDITHATETAQRQIIEASRAPVIASHVALRAVCTNPGNMPDDILQAIAAKGGMVGIHAAADVIGQKYYEWSRGKPSIPVDGVTREEILFGELPLIRSPNQDYGEYIAALDTQQGGRWRRFYSQPWHESPDGEAVVPTMDDWVAHVEHAVKIAGPRSVAIGLDLTNARSTLKNFNYPDLVTALRKRNLATPDVLGESWLRVFDAAKVAPELKIAVNSTTIESSPVFLSKGVQQVPSPNGRNAMAQLVSGSVDMSTGSETQAILNSIAQPDLRIILTLAECRYRIVARKSAGIQRVADLKGKRVATTANTSAEYYLKEMLRTANLPASAVTTVPMEGAEMPAALKGGVVDAVAIWEPHAQNSIEALGADAVELQNSSVYRERFNLNTTTKVLNDPDKRRALVAYLKELRRTSGNLPINSVATSMNLPAQIVSRVWKQFTFPAALPKDLLDAMIAVETWAAAKDTRKPRSANVLAGLIDRTLLAESQK